MAIIRVTLSGFEYHGLLIVPMSDTVFDTVQRIIQLAVPR